MIFKFKLVDNWRSLWRAACLWVAGLGIFVPDMLQMIADNSESLPWFDPDWKNMMRIGALAGVVVARFVKQEKVNAP